MQISIVHPLIQSGTANKEIVQVIGFISFLFVSRHLPFKIRQ